MVRNGQGTGRVWGEIPGQVPDLGPIGYDWVEETNNPAYRLLLGCLSYTIILVRIWTATFVLVTILFGQSASARTWNRRHASPQSWVDVTLPADALPPGPAVARVTLRPVDYREYQHEVHLLILPGTATHARIWSSYLPRNEKVQVSISGANGSAWHDSVEGSRRERPQGTGVVGQPADLTALSSLLHQIKEEADDSEEGHDSVSKLHLISTEDGDACDSLLSVRLAVVAGGLEARSLLTCAAFGARLVIVGGPVGTLAALPEGQPADWGMGSVTWVRTMADLGKTLRKMGWPSHFPRPGDETGESTDWADQLHSTFPEEADPHPAFGVVAVAGILGGFLCLTIVSGIVVSRRRRRPWLAWSWFPLAALLATGVLAIAGHQRAEDWNYLYQHRVAILSPDGVGSEHADLLISTLDSGIYALTVPWPSPELTGLDIPHRLGSPFSSSAGVPQLREDPQAQRLDIPKLGIGRMRSANLGWTEEVQRLVPLVEQRADGLWVSNPTNDPIEHGFLCLERGWAEFDQIQAGQQRALGIKKSALLPSPGTPAAVLFGRSPDGPLLKACLHPREGSYLLITVRKGKVDPVLHSTPALPIRSRMTEIVAGPLARVEVRP